MQTFVVTIAAPPARLFDYLGDPRHRPQWQSSLRSVRLLDDGPPRIGTRWADRMAVGGESSMEIVRFEPPDGAGGAGAWAEVARWHGLVATLALTFDPVPGAPSRTALGVTVDVQGRPRWLAAALRTLAPTAIRSDLRQAARVVATL
ncbi:SRPBCC family protein [Antribacter gilvus]|uniref:SRPBCC family protein n=1 Tax=Antribacter gilvus TaxID=2304675 RepID=UPI000F78CD28|nr:SRPBCC family protein [Antribacter gilvus]